MQFEDALTLIKHPQIPALTPATWADFGSGSGLFTNALASLLAPGSKIYAIDKNVKAFRTDQHANEIVFEKVQADFATTIMKLTPLDGILMANSLHFVSDKIRFIKKIIRYFRHHEFFIIVEYDTDQPNSWVPYPISYHSLQQLFLSLQVSCIHKIHELPSRYNHANIYSALVRSNRFIS